MGIIRRMVVAITVFDEEIDSLSTSVIIGISTMDRQPGYAENSFVCSSDKDQTVQ